MTYAAFWKRLLAFIIDTVVVNICSYILGFCVGLVIGIAGAMGGITQDTLLRIAQAAGFAAGACVFLFYYSLFESSAKQATLGKMALGVKVIDVYGNRLTFGKAFLRTICKFISLLPLGLGCLIALFTQKKQALHDLLVKTLVVNS
ncbi:MAG: RDD family protein [Elusimicrobium sp.]|jgi:uncharacterized RDD family membrane protein YckC|nr:RDD family protein [Elusimicrobium sp.]